MKKLLILVALFASATLYSCDKSNEGGSNGSNTTTNPGSDFADPDAAYTLSDFNQTHMPKDFDTWVIEDTEAKVEEFYGLSAALSKIGADEDNERKITLIFSKMEEIPNYALLGVNFLAQEGDEEVELDVTFSPEYNMSAVTSISAPAAKKIGSYAFVKCFNLASIDFPEAVSVGHRAFLYASSLTALDASQFPKLESIGSYAFDICGALTSVDLPSVSTLHKGGFQLCQLLTQVNLKSAQNIGDVAFSGCRSLKVLSAPAVENIGGSAFTGCNQLKNITMATTSTLDKIDANAFYGLNTSLISLTLGSSNRDVVTGSTLEIGQFSATFASIAIN